MTEATETPLPPQPERPLLDRLLLWVACPGLFAATIWFFIRAASLGAAASADPAAFAGALGLAATSAGFLVVCASLCAARHAAFAAARRALVKQTGLQRRAAYFEEMLRLIVDNIPNVLFISDRDGRLWFANRETVQPADRPIDSFIGKTLDRLFPTREAELLMHRIRQAQAAGRPVVTMDRRDETAGPRYMETYHIPLPDTSDLHHTVLVTQRDITSVIVERERQEQVFRQLVDVLIAVIDRRDPYAAGHSLRVGTLAADLAQNLDMNDEDVETCRIAGALMNLGKIMVPRRILVKTSALDPGELKLVRKSILASADILSLISFPVPIIPVLRQVLERFDGSGAPEGRKGENILLPARIVSLCNAFVALVSPRAHRAGLSAEEALAILQKDSGKAFDPKLVHALDGLLKNAPELSESLARPTPEALAVVPENIVV